MLFGILVILHLVRRLETFFTKFAVVFALRLVIFNFVLAAALLVVAVVFFDLLHSLLLHLLLYYLLLFLFNLHNLHLLLSLLLFL